ncbi:family 16 glycosylhydrolase [Acuticoccus kalidii]|uniref:family 16 glycosylhydrolase n=1 Tax=Acuticoccus kalidii TaxID=2910977 RepID=UPI002714F460|nr:family 16 glycosylhydrolase [Acuticoccus kalidii]
MNEIGTTKVLMRDDFNVDGRIDSSVWKPNVGQGSFLGLTQMRPTLPVAEGGVLRLKLDTYNPSGDPRNPTFFGSEAITNEFFDVGNGIAFEGEMRLAQPQRGLIAGFFPYWTDHKVHDEIDVELIPNRGPDIVQSNIFVNNAFDEGDYKLHSMDAPLTEYHTYRIEWLPNTVRWFVDGELVRVSDESPTRPMALHLNIWGPGNGWDTSDPSFKPTGNASQNRSAFFEVDWVQVVELANFTGSGANEALRGTAASDMIRAGGGDDVVNGGAGFDTIWGGAGNDHLIGKAGEDHLVGGAGNDSLAGNAHDDVLRGGAGDDTLDGGRGTDTMVGDDGADTFLFRSVADSPAGPARDRVADFDAQWGDMIDLSAIDANMLVDGDQSFHFLRRAEFGSRPGTGDQGELRYEASGNGILLQGDVDGDGVADFEVYLNGTASLFADALVL